MKSKTLDWLPITPPRGYKVASPPYIRMHGQGASVLIEAIPSEDKWVIGVVETADKLLARLHRARKTAPRQQKGASRKYKLGSSHRIAKQPGARKGAGKAGS